MELRKPTTPRYVAGVNIDYDLDSYDADKLEEKRSEITDAMRQTISKAEKEERTFNDHENRTFDELYKHSDALKERIDWLNTSQGRVTTDYQPGSMPGDERGVSVGEDRSYRPGEIRKLSNKEQLRSLYPSDRSLSVGKMVRGIVTGDFNGAEEERDAMSTLAGGTHYMIPTPLSNEIIDLARNRSAVMNAGATTVPMDSQTISFARAKNDPTAGWKEENEFANVSDIEFEQVQMRARTLFAVTKLSIELMEDAPNIDSVVENALSQALALELDRAALLGTGSDEEPLGLRNQDGIQTLDMNGQPIDGFNTFSHAVQKIREVNGEPNTTIYSARTSGEIDRLKDGQGIPLATPQSYDDLNKIVSNQVRNNYGEDEDQTEIFVGDFSQMFIGTRQNIVLEASKEAGEMFYRGQVAIRAYLRADVALAKPQDFVAIQNVGSSDNGGDS